MPADDRVAEDRSHRAVDVPDGHLEDGLLPPLDGGRSRVDDPPVQVVAKAVGLGLGAADVACAACFRLGEDRREVQPAGFPVVDGLPRAKACPAADHLVERAEAQLRHPAADVLGHEEHVPLKVLVLAGELVSLLGQLRGDADRAGAVVALALEESAQADEGGRAEAEALRPEQRRDDDVAPRLHLAVGLHQDPPAQAVGHQRLLRLGQAELPRAAGVLDARQRAGARAAVVPGDEHLVGVSLGHARRHRPPRPASPRPSRRDARTSGRRSTGPGPRWNRCRDAAAGRSARRPAWRDAGGRSPR